MKSLEEIRAIKKQMQSKVAVRNGTADTHITVAMGTCGISAGARDVLCALVNEIENLDMADRVTVSQSGCMKDCGHEPMFTVCVAGKEPITYVNMTAQKAKEVVEKHIKNGQPVLDYTVNK